MAEGDAAAAEPVPVGLLRLGWMVAIVVLVADQAHKWWMLKVWRLAEGQRVTVLPFLDFVYVKNLGISYRLFTQDGHLGQWLLTGFAVVAVALLTLWLRTGVTTRLLAVSVGLIIGGAIGNAIDRVLIGGVADFFSLHAFGFYWYVFNIADVAIVAGVIGMLWDSLVTSRKA